VPEVLPGPGGKRQVMVFVFVFGTIILLAVIPWVAYRVTGGSPYRICQGCKQEVHGRVLVDGLCPMCRGFVWME
jgi:hypothetical protein